MGDTLSINASGSSGGNGDGEYSMGEARRQIHALWQKYTDLSIDTSSNVKELARIGAQNDYMVRLLEKIDTSNQLALPRCAERGVKIEDLKVCGASVTGRLDAVEPKIEKLEATQRTLKWVAVIISGVITAICVKFVMA